MPCGGLSSKQTIDGSKAASTNYSNNSNNKKKIQTVFAF